MKTTMSSCELVSTVTAISCAIANCVPKEDLSLVAAIFGEIAGTLSTIIEQEERLNPDEPKTPPIVTPDTNVITAPVTPGVS